VKLSGMKQILASRRIQLTKSLGQNFLHDTNQLLKIVQQAELSPSEKVLEIGPGLGPLTEHLLKEVGQVLAIEMDARLVSILRERFASELARQPGLELVQADALEFLRRQARDWREWKLVANLPYSVASPILVEMAQGERAPERIVVTLQIEVARRLAASPGHADYGVLTLLVQRDFEPLGWFKIPPGSFFPEPDVDSACITLRRRVHPVVPDRLRTVFTSVVKRSFSQRRKMMLKLLKQDWQPDALEHALSVAGIRTDARAEQVSLEAFAQLTETLTRYREQHARGNF
jgi:16S rRNA (adenine1518-N6/adenine1519-N6)-dimethyltransferase